MGSMIDRIKVVLYRHKYRKNSVKIATSCRLSFKNVDFEGNNAVGKATTFRGKIGYGSYIGKHCNINATIGRYCSISSDVNTISGTHPTTDFVSTHPSFFSTKKQAGFTYVSKDYFVEEIFCDEEKHLVKIGNDVWIGSHVLILPGVQIGDGAIIAAGAVVTKNVEPYAIVGGVPAKVIRYRFNETAIKQLLEIKWWDKSEEWIENHAEEFNDIHKWLEVINSEG